LFGVSNGYRIRVSQQHADSWIGVGDLVVLKSSGVVPGATVVVQGLRSTQAEGFAWVAAVDSVASRVAVVDEQGNMRQLAGDRIFGKVEGSISGVGNWLTWLSRPTYLLIGLVLPFLAIAGLELQEVMRLWHATKKYRVA
jgi:hypothetical protein